MQCLSEEDRRSLLQWARQAIIEAVAQSKLPARIPGHGIFAERHGVFVTLQRRGRLRGCIGVVENAQPLAESIVQCAAAAALRDPRFSPLREEELAEVQIEISLLSPPMPIRLEEIEIGRHGLLVVGERHRGLLLPQVAMEYHFDREQFLEETCLKAGLYRQAWKQEEVRIFGFTCIVFSEDGRHSGE